MLRLLRERAQTGVDVRILGKIGKPGGDLRAEVLPNMRLHVRAMLRDQLELFVGSQGLRGIELDRRREVGILVLECGLDGLVFGKRPMLPAGQFQLGGRVAVKDLGDVVQHGVEVTVATRLRDEQVEPHIERGE